MGSSLPSISFFRILRHPRNRDARMGFEGLGGSRLVSLDILCTKPEGKKADRKSYKLKLQHLFSCLCCVIEQVLRLLCNTIHDLRTTTHDLKVIKITVVRRPEEEWFL